jgi:hypothetical protein
MSQARYYSPKIRRDLVTKPYSKAQSLQIPMTQRVDWIVAEGISQYGAKCSHDKQASGRAEQLTFDF